MTDHRVLEAMRAAHAALDLLTVRDEAGQPVGWVPMDDMSPVELGEAVRLQAALEGRVTGLRLATVAAADAGGAAEDARPLIRRQRPLDRDRKGSLMRDSRRRPASRRIRLECRPK